MYLTQTQFDLLRSWAQQTPQVEEAYLFGSYAKGEAHSASDIDIAIKASTGNWTSLAAKWEQHLTDKLGVTVNIRTLANPVVREYCDALSVPLKQ
jgi:predicted nucleotidyltransferase